MKRATPVGKEYKEETTENHLKEQLILGDLIWVRQGGRTWWPALLVDENAVSSCNKPRNRSAGDVLVRLYGSYNYMYVNPTKCRSEFEKFLKRSNCSHAEIFRKALEQKLRRTKQHRSSNQDSSPTENSGLQDVEESISKGNGIENQESEASPKNGTRAKSKAVSAGQINESKAAFHSKKNENDALKSEGRLQNNDKNFLVRVSPRRLQGAGLPQSQVKNGSLISEKSQDKKINKRKRSGTSKNNGGQENLKTKSPRLQVNVESGNPHSEVAQEEVEDEKQIKNGARKKLKPDRSNIARASPKRVEATRQSHTAKNGISSRKAQEVVKRKDTEEDKMKKQVGSAGKSPKKSLAVRRTKENGSSLLSESVKPNRAKIRKKLQQVDANWVKASPGKFPEPSPRRIKVMQNLGLVAPSGSPFNRTGQGSHLQHKVRRK
ncbi:PWWP domain [Dillenia turbinata]|uniref:PWWP domain n=1 Tax=Dillenia turbinata TaxID=194707 RepID=A0AAN8W6S8_9MAGN